MHMYQSNRRHYTPEQQTQILAEARRRANDNLAANMARKARIKYCPQQM